MLKVFICEDNDKQREYYKKIVENTIIIENLDMEIAVVTNKSKELLDYISRNDVAGLYFLDVDLKEEASGIALAAEIRKIDSKGFIVFVTTHSEMSYLTFTYKVEAMDYIIKDKYNEVEKRIKDCILEANKRYSSKKNDGELFSVKLNERLINLELDKILFFETSKTVRKVIVHATDRQIEFNGKISDIEEKLDSRFYRCHKSYIINKNNIKELDIKNRIAYMINGEECIISSRCAKGLIK
ncbi:LytR/AlgR family response regulator transcription factor [Clostridium fungisolvens]|uniref:Stage 0 sporulation protein A homolog n=1 Tax=Clostridium fungisolvens TaxID=1604897 RepID=A0A6V8SDJ9_9CLOT|nr:LytTR family DNA-binding domain-containing protein [Clostridium fungisolvens]GFP74622.1 Accessory gene regulator protein A [Clostridium fungisolvens]